MAKRENYDDLDELLGNNAELATIASGGFDTAPHCTWFKSARLEKFLFATGERGLKNLLGTVTMLRERLLEIGNEVLSKQVHEPRDGYLSPVLPSDHVDCR